ncbi:hypothetical protein VP1G_03326 [Cytospora mali]|uniref:Uncharacterized protein n=1 Tax=Cytospora mali TaxID=578113 RepID=A0A194UWB3_CYTMA|nr:hypothetical protein VP1G_03326 [Valsa mali var. pyri (nom. inval.)]
MPQILTNLLGIVISLCFIFFLVPWKAFLVYISRIDLRKRWGGGCKVPGRGDVESGLAAQNSVDVNFLSRDHQNGCAPVIPLKNVTPRHHARPPRLSKWVEEFSQPEEAHIRGYRSSKAHQSVPTPDVRKSLGQSSSHPEKSTSNIWPLQIHKPTCQMRKSCQPFEAPKAPYNSSIPTRSAPQRPHSIANRIFRRTNTDDESKSHAACCQFSPNLPRISAQPPRLHIPRFSAQAFVFDPDITMTQHAYNGSNTHEIQAAVTESSPGTEAIEEEEGPSSRAPSYISENPPPSYRTEAPLDLELCSGNVSHEKRCEIALGYVNAIVAAMAVDGQQDFIGSGDGCEDMVWDGSERVGDLARA